MRRCSRKPLSGVPAGRASILAAGVLFTDAALAREAGLVLRLGPTQEIGRLSYSWYLWHWPVLILAPYVLGHAPGVWLKTGLVLAALVPAAMSLTAVEDRIRFHRFFRVRARRGLVFDTKLSIVAGVVAVAAMRLPSTATGQGTAAAHRRPGRFSRRDRVSRSRVRRHHRDRRVRRVVVARHLSGPGRGGGDNPYFIDRMMDFLHDPANRMEFALYFDADSEIGGVHRILDPQTPFPAAAQRFRERLQR